MLKVGYGECDLGVTCISYRSDRASFVDYTMPIGEDGVIWVSMPPQKLPPITNITWIFDSVSWIFMLISIFMVIISILIITRHNFNYYYVN